MAFFSHGRGGHDVHDEIDALRREVASLARSISGHGAAALREGGSHASDIGNELMQRASAALPVIRRRAHELEETIRDHPGRTLAIAGLATLALAAAVCISASGNRR